MEAILADRLYSLTNPPPFFHSKPSYSSPRTLLVSGSEGQITRSPDASNSHGRPKSEFRDRKTRRKIGRNAFIAVAWSLTAIAFCSILNLTVPQVAHTQTLDQITRDLLANNCAGLNPDTETIVEWIIVDEQIHHTVETTFLGFGPQLNEICQNSTSTTFPTGGGAGATPQTSYVSIRNSTILSRLESARSEIDEPGPMMPPTQKPMPTTRLGNGITLSFLGNLGSFNTPSASSQIGSDSGTVNLEASGGNLIEGLGLFASGIIEGLDRDVTTFQEGYDSTIFGFTAGGDYQITNKFLAGLAFTYTSMDADFTGGGDFNTKAYSPILFASFLPTQQSFIQVVGEYTRNNFTVNRLASYRQADGTPITMGTASSDSYGNVWSLAVLLGYDKPIRNFTIGPRLGLNWSNVQIQDYAETGMTGLELRYNDQWVNSLQSVVGFYGSAAFRTQSAVYVPLVTADYIHEFANSQRFVEAQFVQDLRANPTRFNFQNETPVRNFFNLGVGLIAVLPNGMQPYANFRAMVGNEQFNNYAGIFGLRVDLGG